MPSLLHVVLDRPQIPPNTGNIARLCACTGCRLHLVHPLGFSLDDRHLRRAGLDYWPFLEVEEHPNMDACVKALEGCGQWHAFSTKGARSLWQISFRPGDILLFGCEQKGLDEDWLSRLPTVYIPMRRDAPVRSLNLSSACAVAVYEALRQISATGLDALPQP